MSESNLVDKATRLQNCDDFDRLYLPDNTIIQAMKNQEESYYRLQEDREQWDAIPKDIQEKHKEKHKLRMRLLRKLSKQKNI